MTQRRSGKIIFRYFQVILGIAIGVSMIPMAIVQPDLSLAQPVKKKKVPPPPAPPTKGFPGNRTVSASMSGSSCDLNLVALAPEFQQTASERISERSIWGQTTAERPTVWFFVPATPAATTLEFSLQNRQGEDVYRSAIHTPTQAGIIGIGIPDRHAALQLDRDYHWTLKAKVACGTATPNRVYVDGWMRRVSVPNQPVSNTLAEQGLWYDAVTSLARARSQSQSTTTESQLQQDWNDLLNSANLEAITTQPILN
jgi:Domain of Unknown Function (DUF928)